VKIGLFTCINDVNQQDQHKKEAELQIWGWNQYLLFQQHKGMTHNGMTQGHYRRLHTWLFQSNTSEGKYVTIHCMLPQHFAVPAKLSGRTLT
jgi:hypothetical protein